MPGIASLTDHQAADARPILDAVRSKLGRVPNIVRTLANSPAALRGYLGLSEALTGGSFSAAERETVALAVGHAHACGYCLSVHTLMAKGAGLSPDSVIAARQGEGSPLAAFACKVTTSRAMLSDREIDDARATGLSGAQMIEVIAHVALNTLTNYVNHIAATEIDFPVVTV